MRIIEFQQNREGAFTLIQVHLLNRLRTWLISVPLMAVATIVMATVALTVTLWDKSGRTPHAMARFWARMLLVFGFVRCHATGLEKLDPKGSYVLVSNHASYFDTPAILTSIPLQFRFFAKKGLFSIPFMGWFLGRAGHLSVDRGDARTSLKSMSEGARLIKQRGISMLLFPEGGRSLDHMREFKEGAAYIAIKAGVPIVPIGLVNTRNVLRMHSKVIHPGQVELHVGDPIPTEGMSLSDRGRLNTMLEEQVAHLAGEPPVVHSEK
jgi:1-acyl-sn-glycerol-3-phosphate acyltransferase